MARAGLPAWTSPWIKGGAIGGLALMLGLGRMLKARCEGGVYTGGEEFRRFCYSDVQVLWGIRSLDEGRLPYIEAFNEYPVLTGWYQWSVATAGGSLTGYLWLNAIIMTLVAAAVLWGLVALRGWSPRLLWWSLSPAVLLYSFYNWDLLALGSMTAALVAFQRGRYGWAGAWVAIGGATKLFPLVLAPVLFIEILRRHRMGADAWRYAGAGVGVTYAANLPMIILDHRGWWATYEFHAARSANLESIWFAFIDAGRRWGFHDEAHWLFHDHLVWFTIVPLFAVSAWLWWRVHTGQTAWQNACLAAIGIFMLTSKVFSVQYALWLVPFLVLLDVPWRRAAAYVAADLLVFFSLFRFFGAVGEEPYSLVLIAVVARHAAIFALVHWSWSAPGPTWQGRPQARPSQAAAQYHSTADPADSLNEPAPSAGVDQPEPSSTR